MDKGAWLSYSPWGCKKSDTTEATEHARRNIGQALLQGVEKSQAFVNLASSLFSNTTPSAVVDSLFAPISTTCNKLDLKLSSRQKSDASAFSSIF